MINDDGITKSNDPKLAAARLFIGNLPSDRTTKEEVQEKFKQYGKILGISIHKGYGFVQFETETEAAKAVEVEHNSIFKGQPLDLRISTQGGRRGPPMSKRGPPPFKRPHEEDSPFRDNWRQGEDPYADPYWNPAERGPPPPFREPPPRDDPYWRDRYPPPHAPMIPPPRVNGAPHDPYRDDREHFPPVAEPPGMPKKIEYGIERPFDAVIVVTQKSLKLYAEMLERRLFELNMTVDMIFLIHDGALNKAIDDMTRRGVLYILVIQSQHEEHKSITVNIMHGTPQEHRNMPLEDALMMMARNFNAYLSSLRNGSEQPTMGFLLNLLADGKHLSVVELERIIAHLQDRRDRLIEGEGGHKDPQASSIQNANPMNAVNSSSALQQKILGILGNTILNQNAAAAAAQQTSTAPPALALANLAQQFGINISQSAPQSQQQASAPKDNKVGGPSLTDANVKKTLDSLLQNPNLLKSLVPQANSLQKTNAAAGGGQQHMGGGQQGPNMFGQGSGNFGVPQQQSPNNPNQGPPGGRQQPPPQLNPNLFGGQNYSEGGGQQRGGGQQQFHGGYGGNK